MKLQLQRALTRGHGKGVAWGAVTACLVLGLTGCGAQEEALSSPDATTTGPAPVVISPDSGTTPAKVDSGLDVTVGLDRETGAIILPHTRFDFSLEELQGVLATAESYALSECLVPKGVTFVPFSGGWDPAYQASPEFGVWTTVLAERFGFVSPMTEADMRANGVTVNGVPIPASTEPAPAWMSNDDLSSDENAAAVAECMEDPEVARFSMFEMSPGPWLRELHGASELAQQTPEWRSVIDEYQQCLVGKGIEPDLEDDSGISVVGEDSSVINAEQIALALEVVDCKDQVQLVERLTGQIAAIQAPIIHEYANELVAFRAQADQLVAEAREYLASRGVSE